MSDDIEKLFPYNSYRENQREGIEKLEESLSNNNFSLVEAACGTGKSLLSLVPSIAKVRDDNTDYERVFVVTSVKQQQTVIENEIERINSKLDDKVQSLTIKGKADVCTYVQENTISKKEIYKKCDELRTTTSEFGKDNYKDLIVKSSDENSKYSYPTDVIPTKDEKQYCPFYAGFLERKGRDKLNNYPKEFEDTGKIDTDRLVNISSKRGMCPHSVMTEMIEEADVVVGNLNHLFDEKTVEKLTGSIIDEKTILIVDEGHNIIPRSRDLLSKSLTMNKIQDSIRELEGVISILNRIKNDTNESISFKTENTQEIKELEDKFELLLERSPSAYDDVKEVKNIFIDLYEKLNNDIDRNGILPVEEDKTINLRDPEKIEEDKLSIWLKSNTELLSISNKMNKVSQFITSAYSNLDAYETIPNISTVDVFSFLKDWLKSSDSDYYKYVQLTRDNSGWKKNTRCELTLFNCIPTDETYKTFKKFGGGIIMSATLEPIDTFKEVTGLDYLEKNTSTKVNKIQYGLTFPEENRKSLCVNTEKFKSNNKKQAFSSGRPNLNKIRKKYAKGMQKIIQETPGNILIGMPSYKEAKWAGEVLKQHTDIDGGKILIDESSSNESTENMKQEFFDETNNKRILITGVRGTLTEGVDYEGQKLNGVVVCGVPIRNIVSDKSKAIRTCYESRFGDNNGFEYAFVIPAVRKTRQTIGRLIRTNNDLGVRVLMDKRYCESSWDSVRKYLSEQEQEEFKNIELDELSNEIKEFWKNN